VVAHLVRLKLTLLRNGLKRSVWQVVGLVIGLLYGLFVAVLAVAGVVTLSVARPDLLPTVVVLAGSAVMLGWWVVPLLAFGVDSTVDPGRFTTFPIPRRQLVVGLAVGGLVGIPGVMTSLVSLGTVAAWWRDPAALVAAIPAAVLFLLTAVVGSRATTTLVAPLVARRRVRELLAILALVPIFLIGPILSSLEGAFEGARFDGLVAALAWSPLGATWGVPVAVADGEWLVALGRLAVAALTLLVLAVVWDRSLAHSLVNPIQERAGGTGRDLGWFGRLPATPLGAVTARCLTYWVRDPRYAASLVFLPVVPIFLWFVSPGGDLLLVLGPVAAYFMGWGISADVAYDGSSFWTHVAAPLRGSVDRLGRVLSAALLGVPVVLACAVVPALALGRPQDVPALVGVSFGVLLTSWGASSIASALVVYPVQKAGENPFQTKSNGGTTAVVSQLGGSLVVAVACLPEAVLAFVAVRQGIAWLGVLTLVVGLVLGAVALVVGVRVGGRVLERRQTELLRQLVSFA
jgi:ABC-2 type transport system permease protein